MSDLIDRQETLDALDKRFESLLKRFDYNSYENADEKTKLVCDGLSEAEDVVMGLPSALSTNLAEVGTDAISRQQAINKILGQPPEPHYPSWYAEQIKELPPAEPKRAKWERHYSRPGVFADLCWHCSACGYKSSDGWANKFNFCPNCGSYNGGET